MTNDSDEFENTISSILREAPKRFLEQMLRKKLSDVGVKVSKASLTRAAEQILSDGSESIRFGNAEADAAQIEVTEDDLNAILKSLEELGEITLPKIIKQEAERSARELYKTLNVNWVDEHKRQIADLSTFKSNLEQRYGPGLDKLRMLVTIAREWGQEIYNHKRRHGGGFLSHLDDVLLRLHVRACQISMEITALLETGLADGAMARWRTLHEIVVVATMIAKHGEDVARRYADYQIVESKKALIAYVECHEALGYRPMSKRQSEKIDKGYARVIRKYGKTFCGEYGWVAHLIGKGPKKRVTFADIQEAVGHNSMRSHYRMASYNVHASPKGVYFKLGQLETTSNPLAGASNAGLVEPAQNTAISLGQLTVLVCNGRPAPPPFDSFVFARVISMLMEEIPRDFSKADRKLKRDHKKFNEIHSQ